MDRPRFSPLAAILYGGLLAGTLDIGAAALLNAVNPVIILQAIASGLLGKAAFTGGLSAAALGLGLQWVMSWVIAGIFVLAASRLATLRRRWLPAGIAYGVVIFFVMEYVVVPLSAARSPHFTPASFGENLLAMIVFGLIVAFFARTPASGAAGTVRAG